MSDTVKLIIEIPTGGAFERDIYTPICAEGFIRDEYNEKVAEAIKNGIPLDNSHPVIINEDGKSAYLTQGHIDALLEYEDKQRQERVMRDVIDVIRKVNNNDPV